VSQKVLIERIVETVKLGIEMGPDLTLEHTFDP